MSTRSLGRSGVDWGTLVHQAPATAELYMSSAIRWLDERYGEGFAVKHPQLVEIYVNACVGDFHSATISKLVRDVVQIEVAVTRETEE